MAIAVRSSSLTMRDEIAVLKRERIISVAAELFYERGYENTSLDAIAEQMSVTKPFIYVHFLSKAELLAEICSRGMQSSLEALNRVTSMEGTPTQLLGEVARQFMTVVLTNRQHIAIFVREEKNLLRSDFHRITQMKIEFQGRLTELLEDGCATGEFSVENASMTALAIAGMISWSYAWYRDTGRFTINEIVSHFATLILAMVNARPTQMIPARLVDAHEVGSVSNLNLQGARIGKSKPAAANIKRAGRNSVGRTKAKVGCP